MDLTIWVPGFLLLGLILFGLLYAFLKGCERV